MNIGMDQIRWRHIHRSQTVAGAVDKVGSRWRACRDASASKDSANNRRNTLMTAVSGNGSCDRFRDEREDAHFNDAGWHVHVYAYCACDMPLEFLCPEESAGPKWAESESSIPSFHDGIVALSCELRLQTSLDLVLNKWFDCRSAIHLGQDIGCPLYSPAFTQRRLEPGGDDRLEQDKMGQVVKIFCGESSLGEMIGT
jgi:hypothetical protein